MSYPLNTTFKRKAVEPVACIKAGWDLIRGQFWLFVGITFVGLIIGSFVPMGILLGPMMCGIYLSLFRRMRGEPIEFGTLFQGFDYFGPSLIATLLHFVPVIAILLPVYFIMFVFPLLMIPLLQHGDQPNPAIGIVFIAAFVIGMIVIMVLMIVVNIAFMFSYPLIVDRKLQGGVDAVKLSAKAGMTNFWQLLGLLLLNAVMGFVGVLLCYVGVFLVLPVSFAAIAIAYTQVFGLGNVETSGPPPPPKFT